MHEFSVWAPAADQVEVVLVDGRSTMEPVPGGWWRCAVAAAGHGTRYAFSVDGGEPRPDPRSPSQPDGVHGMSEVVDHDRFEWHDDRWRGVTLRGAVLYELHVGTFSPTGTFDGLVERLPHLVDLGVDAIEVMPVAEFPGRRGWGYDGVDLFAPHHGYGGPDGLKRLVDASHAAGLGVVLDVVYNHVGPSGNYLRDFGPYFTDRHVTNWGDAVNFDGPGSDEVRCFVVGNALMWLRDYHCDGLRLDAVHAIVDESAVHILEQLADEVRALAAALRRPLFLVAENDRNDPRLVRARAAGGHGLDASWADDWHHALHTVLTGERDGYYEDFGTLDHLVKALRQAWVYDGVWSPHRGRVHGRSPAGLAGDQFVVCTQNHDQVGNRAAGNRLAALTAPGRLKVAAALLLTGPFTPLLFQGEEWAAGSPFQYFTDHDDAALGRAVSEGRRAEFAAFGWDPTDVPDPQDSATFERSKLDWSELADEEHGDVLAWYRELLALRRRSPDLTDPRLERPDGVDAAADPDGLVTVRRGSVTVLANLCPSHRVVPVPPSSRVLAASDSAVVLADAAVTLPPDTAAVISGPATPPSTRVARADG
jgi:maltooligosyltrehalose trehalohydrolase